MEIHITEDLKMESLLPFSVVENFRFDWRPNQHAVLELAGFINREMECKRLELYNSKVKVWTEKDGREQILFYGGIGKIEEQVVGNTTKVCLEAESGSCGLDREMEKRSFQEVDKTYAEVAHTVVESGGGNVICAEGKELTLERPLIQYEETAWEFIKRLASRLGTCVIPDIETGKQNVWFGMRKGADIPSFSEQKYSMNVRTGTGGQSAEESYEIEGREFYKLGDRTIFLGKKMLICGVSASFIHGDLIFRYLLKERENCKAIYREQFIGLGLTGTVAEVRKERVRIALDIDGENAVGNYFYHWYPETGNALYAMPEIGARILLYFGSRDEQEGYALHCLPEKAGSGSVYTDRHLHIADGNTADLSAGNVSFSRGSQQSLSVGDGHIYAGSSHKLSIHAMESVQIDAGRMMISTPDELDICQG